MKDSEIVIDKDAPAWTPERLARAIAQVCSALRSHLEARTRQLSDEIRRYPTPIARCDEQLPKLIEQRAHVLNRIKVLGTFEAGRLARPDRSGIGPLRQFLRDYPASDDDVEMLAVSRLKEALSAFPGPERLS